MPPRDGARLDVILAYEWKTLWTAGADVLPLSLSTPNTVERAAVTLLVDLVTRAKFGRAAVFAEEAYGLLGIAVPAARDRLQPRLTAVLDTLGSAQTEPVDAAWNALVAAVGTESQRDFRKKHYRYTEPLGWLRAFLLRDIPRTGPGPDRAPGQRWRVGRFRRLFDGLGEGCPAYRSRPVEQPPPDPLRR